MNSFNIITISVFLTICIAINAGCTFISAGNNNIPVIGRVFDPNIGGVHNAKIEISDIYYKFNTDSSGQFYFEIDKRRIPGDSIVFHIYKPGFQPNIIIVKNSPQIDLGTIPVYRWLPDYSNGYIGARIYDKLSKKPVKDCRITLDTISDTSFSVNDGLFEFDELVVKSEPMQLWISHKDYNSKYIILPIDKFFKSDTCIIDTIFVTPTLLYKTRLMSIPSKANVYIDKIKTGLQTDCEINIGTNGIMPGKHEINLVKSFYFRSNTKFEIDSSYTYLPPITLVNTSPSIKSDEFDNFSFYKSIKFKVTLYNGNLLGKMNYYLGFDTLNTKKTRYVYLNNGQYCSNNKISFFYPIEENYKNNFHSTHDSINFNILINPKKVESLLNSDIKNKCLYVSILGKKPEESDKNYKLQIGNNFEIKYSPQYFLPNNLSFQFSKGALNVKHKNALHSSESNYFSDKYSIKLYSRISSHYIDNYCSSNITNWISMFSTLYSGQKNKYNSFSLGYALKTYYKKSIEQFSIGVFIINSYRFYNLSYKNNDRHTYSFHIGPLFSIKNHVKFEFSPIFEKRLLPIQSDESQYYSIFRPWLINYEYSLFIRLNRYSLNLRYFTMKYKNYFSYKSFSFEILYDIDKYDFKFLVF